MWAGSKTLGGEVVKQMSQIIVFLKENFHFAPKTWPIIPREFIHTQVIATFFYNLDAFHWERFTPGVIFLSIPKPIQG